MKIPERKDCIHSPVCKYHDGMCATECAHFAEYPDNIDYMVVSQLPVEIANVERNSFNGTA